MAVEEINEPVGIIASFATTSHGVPIAKPEIMSWRGRRYRIDKLGLRYPTPQGRRLRHRFTFSTNDTMFEVEFDTETLAWQLLRLSDGYAT